MNKTTEVKLTDLYPSPVNPRKDKDGPGFEELVASIREKGVLEPILVREKKGPGGQPYEIVAGERRFVGSAAAGKTTIPAIVMTLTDDEAFDVMMIENLQRRDLTPREEAETFKVYVDKHGKSAVEDLASRTGVDVRYIRRHVEALRLPERAIKLWDKGELAFGHLELLLRLKDEKEVLGAIRELRSYEGKYGTVEELRDWIGRASADLAEVEFDKKACETCQRNTAAQDRLFAISDGKEAKCLDRACFKKRLNEFLTKHWKETAAAKKFGTTGFRFGDGLRYSDFTTFESYHSLKPGKKCAECVNFVTIIDDRNQVRSGRACLDKKCYASQEAAARAKERGERPKAKRDEGAPRCEWHGGYFRDLFFKRRIPEVVAKLKPTDDQVQRALLFSLARADHKALEAVAKKYKIIDKYGMGDWEKALTKIAELPIEEVKSLFAPALVGAMLDGHSRWESTGYGTNCREAVAGFLGIDVSKEFAVDAEYLKKKTRAELLAFLKTSGLGKDKKFVHYMKTAHGGAEPAKIKKGELEAAIIGCGAELVGLVPDEVLPEKPAKKGAKK